MVTVGPAIEAFLGRLQQAGVELWVEDGRLRSRARKDAISHEDADFIRKHKADIVGHLTLAVPTAGAKIPVDVGTPLSAEQQRLWTAVELTGPGDAYNVPLVMHLHGHPDPAVLEQALRTLLGRHAPLRSILVEIDEGHVHAVPQPIHALPFTQIALKAAVDRDEALAALQAETRHAFDLRREIPIRCCHLSTDRDSYLCITFHHLVVDAESVAILLSELCELYTAIAWQQAPRLSPQVAQYSEYVAWQRKRTADPVYHAEATRYRGEQFHAFEPSRCLMPDIGHRDLPRGTSGHCRIEVPADLRPDIDAIARKHKLTLFALLQSMLSLYLAEITDGADFAIASPVSTRDASDLSGTVGFFVKDLMLRHVPRQAGETLDQYLPGVRQRFIDAMRFRHATVDPPDMDAGAVADPAHHGMAPEVIFAFQTTGASHMEIGGIPFDIVPMASATAKTDLVLYAADAQGILDLSWEYDSALFSEAYIHSLARGFLRFLAELVRNPNAPIASASLVDTEEEHRLHTLFVPVRATANSNDGRVDSEGTGLVDAWRSSAARHGDRIALIEGDRKISYRELDATTDRYAAELMALGVSAGDRVGLLLPRSMCCVMLMLASAKIGAAYVPVDANLPEEAQRDVLKCADARLVIVDDRHFAIDGLAMVTLVDFERQAASATAMVPQSAQRDSLLYIMFTSGSTGEAKGVAVSQGSVLAFAEAPDYIPARNSIVAFCSLPSFDASTFEVWATLLNGHTLQIHAAGRIDPPEFLDWMRSTGIQVVFITSALFEVLMSLDDVRLPAMTHLIVGGDVAPVDAIRRFMDANGAARCFNGYGPTENTTFSTVHAIDASDLHRSILPIGRPLAATGVAVVNAALQLVPPGHVGELILTGAQLADGYWKLPALSAQRFVRRPQDGTRCYRTGDRVRWNARGALEFVGRQDDQVKISGYRIELSELRARLEAVPGIRTAVVLARKTGSGAKVIHAFYRPDSNAPSSEQIMARLAAELPSYMLPSRLDAVESLPLTRNGKVDQRKLIEQTEHRFTAATTTLQGWDRLVAAAWEAILGRPCPDIDADFFALGGHSLTATRLALRLGELLGTRVPLGDVFRHATIRTQSEYCRRHAIAGTAEPALQRRGSKLAPLSFSQRRLWVLDQLCQGPAFNIPMAIRLRGQLDRAGLEKAFNALLDRHEILRTRYVVEGDEPRQVVVDGVRLTLREVDCSVHPMPDQVCTEMIAAEASTPFDLANDLMLRARLFTLSGDEAILSLNIHHIACDGWSIAILVEELSELYAEHSGGPVAALPTLPFQYSDYALWQREHAQGPEFQRQLRFWTDRLANLPATHNLPLDRARPDFPRGTGDVVSSHVPPAVRARLEAFAQVHEATPFAVISAVFACLLARYSGDTDIVFGTPVANREQPGLGRLVGFFVNTLVLRTDLSANPSLQTLVASTRTALVDTFSAQSVPFETLVEVLQPERSANHSPLFQVMLSMHTNERRDLRMPGIEARPIRSGVISAQYDLTLDVIVTDEGTFELGWEFADELFDRDSILRLASHFGRLLEGMLASPDQPYLQVPLLGDEEIATCRAQWSGPVQETPADLCIHHLVEAQAAQRPHAIAVTHDGRHWTYQEIEHGANALAQRLLGAGVSLEERVGLSTGRGVETVLGMLAIMKCGAAYVPLEPDTPDARLREIIQAAGIVRVVVQPEFVGRAPFDSLARVTIEASPSAHDEANPSRGGDSLPVCRTVSGSNAAYVVFTSGSTGIPKGVVCEHGALVDRWMAWDRMLGLSQDPPVVLQMASLSVDICLGDMVKALASGGRLVLCPRDTLLSPEELWALMQRERVTFGDFVPSVLRSLAGHLVAIEQKLMDVRQLLVGCEAWYGRDLHLLQRVLGPTTRCYNIYGQTESIIDAAYLDVTELELAPGDVLQIGMPLANTELSVRNAGGQLQPIGVNGELCVAGPALAREYLAQPELTGSKFVRSDSNSSGHRMYRTGDVVKRLPDGRIAFAGRTDDQVKIRGFRVVLREVEEAMLALPRVTGCVALAKPTASGDRMLVAYVTVDGAENSGLVAMWREALTLRMPDYMVPTAFCMLETIPLTPTGKVDRQKLLQLELDAAVQAEHAPPQTPLECTLADVWRAVLGLERVGVLDNFFSIGGDSIRVIQLVTEAKRHGIAFAAKDIFSFQCIRHLAEHVGRTKSDEGKHADHDAAPPLELLAIPARDAELLPNDIDDAYPVTALQAMMLARHGTHCEIEGVYLPQQVFEFEDAGFQAEHLHSALRLLIARHPTLRAGFVRRKDGGYLQVIRRSVPTPLEIVDLTTFPQSEQEAVVGRYIAEDLAHPFDTDAEGRALMRYTLFDMGHGRWRLLLSTHHAIDDGWGFVEFMNELMSLYARARAGDLPGVLAPAADVFRERVALELEAARSDRSASFWRDHLAQAPRIPLPVSGDTSMRPARYLTRSIAMDPDVLPALTERAKSGGWQIKTAALLAYFHCLSSLCGHGVTVDVVSSGRSDRLSDPFHSLGLFWNFSPIHFATGDMPDPAECGRLQALLLAASEHVMYPTETLKAQGKIPPVWASFNYVHFHNMQSMDTPTGTGSAETLKVVHESDRFHHAMSLMVSLDKSATRATVMLCCNSANIDSASMDRFLREYIALVRRIAGLGASVAGRDWLDHDQCSASTMTSDAPTLPRADS